MQDKTPIKVDRKILASGKKNIPRYYIYQYLSIFFLPETSVFYLKYICILDYFILWIYKLLLKTEDLFRYSYRECRHELFDKMVKPILLFGSEIWGFSKTIDCLEKIQLRFCKLLLKLMAFSACFVIALLKFPVLFISIPR
jgi:hypothetical protein